MNSKNDFFTKFLVIKYLSDSYKNYLDTSLQVVTFRTKDFFKIIIEKNKVNMNLTSYYNILLHIQQ